MGRVYNALISAERWKDRSRRADHPAQGREAAAEPVKEERPERAKQDAPAPAVNTRGSASSLAGAVTTRAARVTPPAQAYAHASERPSLNHNDIALSDILVNGRPGLTAPRPREAQPIYQPARNLHVAPPPPPAPVFVEPRMSVKALDLKVEPQLTAIVGTDELSAERYRTLAVRLINISAGRKLKTLLVTSAQEGEGKSTVAANLAWVMAKPSERRVLLIDADLRCPSIGRMLGIQPRREWLDLVEGGSKLEDTAIRIDPNGLYVLSARARGNESKAHGSGTSHAGMASSLTSSRVEKLIKDLEQHFDVIIIDSPPILEFAESQRLASIVDGVVFVTRAGYTHHDAVTDGLKLVPKDRRLGVVLNESQIDEEIAYHNKKESWLTSLLGSKR